MNVNGGSGSSGDLIVIVGIMRGTNIAGAEQCVAELSWVEGLGLVS